MGKTLSELYKDNAGNYILLGEGGSGKSTQLKVFRNELIGKEIIVNGNKKIVIPIYKKMIEFNRIKGYVDGFDFFLYDLVRQYFPNTAVEQIKCLLSSSAYQFVFLLDGANELIDFREGFSSVYVHLVNCIMEVLSEFKDSVNIIISSRNIQDKETNLFGYSIKSDVYASFKVYRIGELSTEQITAYMGKEYNSTNIVFLRNPMVLGMYKVIVKNIGQLDFADKNEIINNYFKVLIDSKKMQERYVDTNFEELKVVYEAILPYIAYNIQYVFLENSEQMSEYSLEKFLVDYADIYCKFRNDNEKSLFIKKFEQLVLEQKLIDETTVFSHQMFMEYFASKGLKLPHIKNRNSFIKYITNELFYDATKNDPELGRRTKYLGLAESIISEAGAELSKYISDKELLQCFYQETAGVYEDLKSPYRERASHLAWISYRYLIGCKPTYAVMCKKNTLFVCMLKNINEIMEYKDITYTIEVVADELIKYVNSHKPDVEEQALFAKVLNNIGAMYTVREDYENAYVWHIKALEFRKEHKLNLLTSYKVIMGDIYHLYILGNQSFAIKDAYDFYLRGLGTLAQFTENDIKDLYCEGRVPVDFAERGLGVIFIMIRDMKELSLIDDAIMIAEYVYDRSVAGLARIDANNLKNLKQKMEDFLKIDIPENKKEIFRSLLYKIDTLI